MMHKNEHLSALLGLFADLLDYPSPDIAALARECKKFTSAVSLEASGLIGDFLAFIEVTPVERIEEIYTGTFDLNPICHPYVGFQLFGETYKRSKFLVGLKDLYRKEGFQFSEFELPDRLSVILRFVSRCSDECIADEIIDEGLLPALAHMTQVSDTKGAELPNQTTDEFDTRLEGHSEGEVLKGGFLLAQSADEFDSVSSKKGEFPYYQALAALLIVLRIAHPSNSEERVSILRGEMGDVR